VSSDAGLSFARYGHRCHHTPLTPTRGVTRAGLLAPGGLPKWTRTARFVRPRAQERRSSGDGPRREPVVCLAAGNLLLEVAQSYPGCHVLVLCGHTHGDGEVRVLDNLRVLTGAAEYGDPKIEEALTVE
jgi:hypothetical protein